MDHLTRKSTSKAPKLFALPGESNSSGLKHNVRRYVDHAREHGWDVCVDVAAFAPANAIPTGVGCLVAKQSSLKSFQKPWFAGGTVRFVGVSSKECVPLMYRPDRHEPYEDCTVNFQGLGAVIAGILYMREMVGMHHLSCHVQYWSALLEMRLRNMTRKNGARMVVISPIMSHDEERGARTRPRVPYPQRPTHTTPHLGKYNLCSRYCCRPLSKVDTANWSSEMVILRSFSSVLY
jgi:selenocysteine lyase/cysteine desulfurase